MKKTTFSICINYTNKNSLAVVLNSIYENDLFNVVDVGVTACFDKPYVKKLCSDYHCKFIDPTPNHREGIINSLIYYYFDIGKSYKNIMIMSDNNIITSPKSIYIWEGMLDKYNLLNHLSSKCDKSFSRYSNSYVYRSSLLSGECLGVNKRIFKKIGYMANYRYLSTGIIDYTFRAIRHYNIGGNLGAFNCLKGYIMPLTINDKINCVRNLHHI